jgi:hypothetical protein
MWVGTSVISPSGKVHPATFFHHDEVCERICEAEGIVGEWPSSQLARRGYIKLCSDGRIFDTEYGPVTSIRQAQYDAIWDMAMELRAGCTPHDGEMSYKTLEERLSRLEVQ